MLKDLSASLEMTVLERVCYGTEGLDKQKVC